MTGLPKGWALATVDEVAATGGVTDGPFGSNLKTDHYTEAGPRVVRLQNIGDGVFRDEKAHISEGHFDRLAKHAVEPSDVLVASLGELLPRACMAPESLGPAIVKADCIRVRAGAGVVPALLMWSLNAPQTRHRVGESIKGVGRPRVNLGDLRALELPIPPLPEQQRIVAAIEEAFSKLDAGEAGLRTVRQLLKRMRDAVLAAAVTGRLVPQDPAHAAATSLLASVGVRSASGDLPVELPFGWASVAIGDLAEVISGPAFKSAQFGGADDGIRLLRGENIEPGSLRWKDTRTWPTDLLEGYEHLLVEPTDLILAMDRPVVSAGLKLAPVRPGDLPALLVQRVARIRPVHDDLRRYLWIAMQNRRFMEHMLGGQVGTQIPHITLKAIRSFEVGLPGASEMARIVAEVERQFSFLDACERAVDAGLARAAAMRRSVLKSAFEGRLVPQDPSDEPASVLLERIRLERSSAPKPARRARRTA